ncbi:MAG: hypothetical protein ACTSQW_04195 [Promethearchaeota archaeon]
MTDKEDVLTEAGVKEITKTLTRSKRKEAMREAEPRPTNPKDYEPVTLAPDLKSTTVMASDIPVANTPVPRYKTLVYKGRLKKHVERIEQCGNRVVITGGGVIHDMRADGTLENGVNDINATTGAKIRVSARFEDGRLNLRLNNKFLAVTRYLDGDEIIFEYGQYKNHMRRLKAPPSS